MEKTNYESVKDARTQFDTTDSQNAMGSVKSKPSNFLFLLEKFTHDELLKSIKDLEQKGHLTNDDQNFLKEAKEFFQKKFEGKEDAK